MELRSVRAHLAVTLVVTCITAWFSYAYFHNDEYFQIIELTRLKLGQVESWGLPWEHTQRMRPWLQPFVYWAIGRVVSVVGVRDVFDLAFVFRLVTGLANVGALALFLRTTLPWFESDEEKRLHLRVATLVGFLPYLFVRTSSESGSMAAVTAGFAILLEGARLSDGDHGERWKGSWTVPLDSGSSNGHPPSAIRRVVLAGLLFGFAFEMRFQTAIIVIGIIAWLRVCARASWRSVGLLALGGAIALLIGLFVDRWGYGVWTFPAWTYFQANVLEGAAAFFGTDPPFSYFWMLPANIFMPVIVVMLALAIVAWVRCPRHPVTWATLPFFLVHNLLSHKEERFLFPMAILSTALVAMAMAPSSGRPLRIATWAWSRRRGPIGKVLVALSTAAMLLLAFVPLGWHHNVRFARYLHEHLGDEVHATALPEINLNLPAFHPRIYDVDKADPEELARRIEQGTARPWLITDTPILRTGVPGLDQHATLVWTELSPFDSGGNADDIARTLRWVDSYNARLCPPMRPLRFRSLYRIGRFPAAPASSAEPPKK